MSRRRDTGAEGTMILAITFAERFIQTLAKGLAQGGLYALVALGFVLIFKATQTVNFAQGRDRAGRSLVRVAAADRLDDPGPLDGRQHLRGLDLLGPAGGTDDGRARPDHRAPRDPADDR